MNTSAPFANDRVAYAYVIAPAVGVSEPWALADFFPAQTSRSSDVLRWTWSFFNRGNEGYPGRSDNIIANAMLNPQVSCRCRRHLHELNPDCTGVDLETLPWRYRSTSQTIVRDDLALTSPISGQTRPDVRNSLASEVASFVSLFVLYGLFSMVRVGERSVR